MQKIGVQAIFDVTAFQRNANIYIKAINDVDVATNTLARGGGFLADTLSTALGNTLSFIATRAIPAAANAVAGFAEEVVATGMDFESQMAVLKTAAGDAGYSMETLGDAAIMVGNDTTVLGASAAGAADAMTLLYRGGLKTNEIILDMEGYLAGTVPLTGALRSAFDLTAASELTLAESADVAVIALSTFGRELDNSEDRAKFAGYAMDFLVRAANASVSEVDQLVESLRFVGPAAIAADLSIEDVSTALALLSQNGIKGSTAGTALNAMFTDLIETTDKSAAEMARLGINIFDAEGKMRPIIDIIGQFEVALQGATDQQMLESLGEIFDVRGSRAMQALLEQGVGGWNNMADAIDGATGMQEQAQVRMDTLAGAAEIWKSTMETLRIELSKEFMPVFADFLLLANDFVQKYGPGIVEVFDGIAAALGGVFKIIENPALLTPLKDALLEITSGDITQGLHDLFLALLDIFGVEDAGKIWLTIKEPLELFRQALDQARDSIALFKEGDLVGGVSSAMDVLATAFGEEKISGLRSFAEDTAPMVQQGLEQLKGVFDSFADDDTASALSGISDVLATMFGEDKISGLRDFVDNVGPKAIGVIEGIVFAFQNFKVGRTSEGFGQLSNAFAKIFGEDTMVKVGTTFDNIKSKFLELYDAAKPLIDGLAAAFDAFVLVIVDDVWPKLQSAFENWKESMSGVGLDWATIWENIKTGAQLVAPIIVAVITAIIGGIMLLIGIVAGLANAFAAGLDAATNAWKIFKDAATGVINGVINLVAGLVAFVKAIFAGDFAAAFEIAKQNVLSFWEIISNAFMAIVAVVGGFIDTVLSLIAGFIQGILDFFKSLYDDLVGHSIVPDMIDDIIKFFKELPTKAYQTVVEFVKKTIAEFGELYTKVKNKVTEIVDTIKDKVSDFIGVGKDLIGGLWDGIKSKFDEIVGRVRGLVEKLPEAVKKVFNITSPSKVFMEIGTQVSEGLGIGIARAFNSPVGALSSVMSGMVRSVSPTMGYGTTNNYYSTSVEVNPTYRNLESEASVYYDTIAALGAAAMV